MHLFLRVFLPWKRLAVLKPHRNSWRRLYRSYMNKKSCLFAGEISLGWPDWLCCLKPACLQINTRKSPHVRESKTVSGFYPVDSWLLIPDSWFQVPNSRFFVIGTIVGGFRNPWAVFRIPKPRISNSTSKNFPDSLDEENEQKKHTLRCGYTNHFTLV